MHALRLQMAAELAQGQLAPGLDGADRHRRALGDLGLGQPIEVRQLDAFALAPGQPPDGVAEQLAPESREHEVVRHLLFVVGQELFDQLAAVAEAQYEVVMFSAGLWRFREDQAA